MALTANAVYLPGLSAGADLSSSQYKVVKFASTAGEVIVVAATTDIAVGILQDDPTDGQPALVQVDGVAKGIAATSVGWTANCAIGFNTTAKLVPLAANTTNDNRYIIGRYLTALGQTTTVTADQIISIQMFGGVARL